MIIERLAALGLILLVGACATATTEGRAPRPGAVFRDCADCPELVAIPSGRFMMGSTAEERARFPGPWTRSTPEGDPESPRREVSIRGFALGRFPITRGQWAAFVAATGHGIEGGCEWANVPREEMAAARWDRLGFAQEDDHPVVCVSWNDAQAYARWLTARTGHDYRLPTEAEWEYAARARTNSAFPWGEEASHEHANYGADQCCGRREDGRDRWAFTSPVGAFPANAFGLHDMHGNAWQWVQDCFRISYAGAPADGSAVEPENCEHRVLRGGTWNDPPDLIRSAVRNWAPPPRWNPAWPYRSGGVGFRVARALDRLP